MSEEKPENEQPKEEKPPVEEPAEQPKITLASIQAEVEKMRNDYNASLKEKDSLINDLKKERDELTQLIGDYKEKLFASSMPAEQIDPREQFDQELRHAYEQFYEGLKSRIVGYDKKAFVDKCMGVEYGRQ